MEHLQQPLPQNFASYLQQMRNVIRQGRRDLTEASSDAIIDANAPYEWTPEPQTANGRYRNGILLIHGLYDSPHSMRDIGEVFLRQGFLVRSLLLPGHGTTPHDLMMVNHQDWLTTVAYGIDRIAPRVDNLFLAGFSMGAALSLIQAHLAENCRGLLLFAPGLKPRHPLAEATRFHRLLTWLTGGKWYEESEQLSYVKYHSHAYHSGHQAILTMSLARKTKSPLPAFWVLTEDDETISIKHCLRYFSAQTLPQNRLLYYSKADHVFTDSRIISRHSVYPTKRIIDFSHSCIPISPTNTHLGENGEIFEKLTVDSQTVFGAKSSLNITQYKDHLVRLPYNPDFEFMMEKALTFSEAVLAR